MERGLSTVFAALAFTLVLLSCLVSAQENETTTEPPTPSNPVGNRTFILYDVKNASKVCLKMQATIVVNITYLVNETKTNMSMVLPLTDDAQSNSTSTCDSGATKAMLYVVPRPGQEDDPQFPYYILFRFTGSSEKGDRHWAWGNITFGVESEFLKYYTGGTGLQEFTTDAALHGDPNAKIEFERSYICDSNQSISFPMANNISAFIYVTDLQVQAFEFKNSSTGEFDNARTCILDSAGKANKIVPIAVGAALAGLVVVVLIAYLIGRLRSRRQSSYEALS